MTTITIMVRQQMHDIVLVQWQDPIVGDLSNALCDVLEHIKGVESVMMYKYSARLCIAPHVTNYDKLLPRIMAAFNDLLGWFQSVHKDTVVFEVIPTTPLVADDDF